MVVNQEGDPWGRTIIPSITYWWWLPLISGLLGAVLGFMNTPRGQSTAQASLNVAVLGSESNLITTATESAVLKAQSPEVIANAAKKRGVAMTDLQARTTVAPLDSSTIISVTVTGATPEKAAGDANAVATAAVESAQRQVAANVRGITQDARGLLTSGKVTNRISEQARLQALGNSLGSAQNEALTQSGKVSILQAASPTYVKAAPTRTTTLMGGLGGALLGLMVALLLGPRRGRVRSARELRRLYPGATIVDRVGADAALAVEVLDSDVVLVSPVGEHTDDRPFRQHVMEQISALGKPVYEPSTVDALGGDQIVDDRIAVVSAPASARLTQRAEGNSRTLLFLVVKRGQTYKSDLHEVAQDAGRGVYVVVEK